MAGYQNRYPAILLRKSTHDDQPLGRQYFLVGDKVVEIDAFRQFLDVPGEAAGSAGHLEAGQGAPVP